MTKTRKPRPKKAGPRKRYLRGGNPIETRHHTKIRKTPPPWPLLANLIRHARVHRGLSQKDVALRLGCHQTVLSSAEAGSDSILFRDIKKLAEVLEVPTDYLVEHSELCPACHGTGKKVRR